MSLRKLCSWNLNLTGTSTERRNSGQINTEKLGVGWSVLSGKGVAVPLKLSMFIIYGSTVRWGFTYR